MLHPSRRLSSSTVAIGLAVGLAAVSGCGDSSGAGGQGGEFSGGSGYRGPQSVVGNGVGGNMDGGGDGCDDGAKGDAAAPPGSAAFAVCNSCVTCSAAPEALCELDWATYEANPQRQDFIDCSAACADGDDACFTTCDMNFPSASNQYYWALGCSVCADCESACNSFKNC